MNTRCGDAERRRTNSAYKDVKGSALDVRGASKVDELDVAFTVENNVLILDVPVYNLCFGVQVMYRFCHLYKDLAALLLFHVDAQLDIVEKVHTGQTVRYHLDVIVDVILKEIGHFYDVRVLKPVAAEIVQDVNLKRHST
jgi:hypothetical protein